LEAIFAAVHERSFSAEEAMHALSRIVQQRGLTTTLLVAVALSASCMGDGHRGSAGLQIRVDVESATPSVGFSRITVHVSDQAWIPRNGLSVTVSGVHPDAPPVRKAAVGEGAGRYVAESFSFPGAGEWILTVRAELPDGRWTERDRVIAVLPPGP
jgi:hypothetical protein